MKKTEMALKLFSTLYLIIAPTFAKEFCDTYSPARCVDGTAFEVYKTDKSLFLFALHSDRDLTQLCHDFKYVGSCWARYRGDCKHAVKATFEGLLEAFHFLCGQGIQKYIRNQECLQNENLKNELEKCQEHLNIMNRIAAEFNPDSSSQRYSDQGELVKKACSEIDEAKKCTTACVKTTCGREAAELEEVFINKMLKPLVDKLCDSGFLLWTRIKLVIVGLLGTLILMAYVLVVIRGNGKSNGNIIQILTMEMEPKETVLVYNQQRKISFSGLKKPYESNVAAVTPLRRRSYKEETKPDSDYPMIELTLESCYSPYSTCRSPEKTDSYSRSSNNAPYSRPSSKAGTYYQS